MAREAGDEAEQGDSMNELTREQFRAAVAGGIFGLEHLYREVAHLVARLREALAQEPEPLALNRGTFGKSGKEGFSFVVRYDYSLLFEPAVEDDDDSEDEEEGDEDDETEKSPSAAGKKRGNRRLHQLIASQPLLAVRIAMYDPRRREAFEPQIEFAVMTDWVLGDPPARPDDRFMLEPSMLKRVARALAERVGVEKGTRIRTTATARRTGGGQKGKLRLSCSLPAGVEAGSLYSIDSDEALERVAERMKGMWTSVIGV